MAVLFTAFNSTLLYVNMSYCLSIGCPRQFTRTNRASDLGLQNIGVQSRGSLHTICYTLRGFFLQNTHQSYRIFYHFKNIQFLLSSITAWDK